MRRWHLLRGPSLAGLFTRKPCAISLDRPFKRLRTIAPALVGAAAFFIVVGPRVLYPTNIAWLASNDPAQHFLGWHFFRNSGWSFPIGLNPSYGLELGNAIAFSDSNPLLAFLFRPFSSILPKTFQYFGIWLLVCFVLQAWLGAKLVGLISSSTLIRVLGSGLFVFAPPMIWRVHVHENLAGHFLILAALFLFLRPTQGGRAVLWAVVLVVATMVHAYLLAMVVVLWLADLIQVLLRRPLCLKKLALEFIAIAAVVALVCWQVGYFSVGSGLTKGGYGKYRMNLLSIFDPSGWSYILPDLPSAQYEGFNFLGLGVIILLLFGLPAMLAGRSGLLSAISKRWLLLIPLAALFIFAVSNKVGIGSREFEIVPLGGPLLEATKIFRASGRMFWPVFYTLVLVAVFIVVRGNSFRVAATLLGVSLVVQVADTRAGWQDIRKGLMRAPAAEWDSPLQSPFWDEAARQYHKVRWLPPENESTHWKVLAAYAGNHGLATDAVYLARIDKKQLHAAKRIAWKAIRTGKYRKDSLYFLDPAMIASAIASLDRKSDVLAQIDGFYVIAPGWKTCTRCGQVDHEIQSIDVPRPGK